MRFLPALLAITLLFVIAGMPASAQQTDTPQPINGPGSTLSQKPRPRVAHSPKIPYGLQLMAHFETLPLLRDTRCVQDSSYDRSGGNGDAGNFLKKEGNKALLTDIKGPGCIYRFWSANAAGHLKIFFDGEKTPRIDCPMQDLFLAKYAPFVSPIVGHRSGGWYCYFPMPFRKSCRIEVTDPGSMYYHVQYQLFPDRTRIRTFTRALSVQDKEALKTVLTQWNRLGNDPMLVEAASQQSPGSAGLSPGESKTIAELKGPANVTALRIRISPATRFTLRQTLLRVYWDGSDKPGIEAPVGDFFGVGFGDQRFAALPDAMTDEGYVCYWPMPFARSARMALVNSGQTDTVDVRWNVLSLPLKMPMKDAGYFHAQWHRQTTVAGEYFHILQTNGRGHYVGEHTDMQGDRGLGFLEGDEKIYTDGETFPSIYGTGTEDFYTGGWYFDEGPFNLAYHGCTVKRDEISRVSAYRYQIQDCVPFQHDIKVDIEHGGTNDYPGADYSCVAYWYQDSPSHDWSPIEDAQLTPAHVKIAGALEAEDLTWTGGQTELKEDLTLPFEASGGKYLQLAGGKPTFSLNVSTEDVYQLQFAVYQPAGPDGTLKLILNPGEAGNEKSITSVVPASNGWTTLSYSLRLKPGAHIFGLGYTTGRTLALDYIRLVPSRKVKGVLEAESLLERADTGGKGSVERIDGNQEYSGYSALVWQPQGSNAELKLPITVSEEADYTLDLGVVRGLSNLQLAARIDTGDILATLDTTAPRSQTPVDRLRFGDRVHLLKGDHTLILAAKGKGSGEGPMGLVLDYIRLQRSRYPYSIEAESLAILEAKDGEATHQDMQGFGPHWSGDAQFWFIGQKQGAEATLELPVQTAGAYNLSVYYTTARDYAIVQVLVDGKEIGSPIDCYTENVLAKGKTFLGMVDLTSGTHRITFRAVDKNPASTNYLIGVDAIGLEPVK
jgi:hypothetical protein